MIYNHPKIKLTNLDFSGNSLNDISCECLVCGKSFLTDRKGLEEYGKSHNIFPLY